MNDLQKIAKSRKIESQTKSRGNLYAPVALVLSSAGQRVRCFGLHGYAQRNGAQLRSVVLVRVFTGKRDLGGMLPRRVSLPPQ